MELAAWADVALGITLAEAVALAAWHALGRGAPAPRQWVCNLASGLCLMLALRAALQPSAGVAWLAWLGAAGAAHLADLLWRLRLRPS